MGEQKERNTSGVLLSPPTPGAIPIGVLLGLSVSMFVPTSQVCVVLKLDVGDTVGAA